MQERTVSLFQLKETVKLCGNEVCNNCKNYNNCRGGVQESSLVEI